MEMEPRIKALLSSSPVLVHYDPDSPLRLACDASAYRVGAVISHNIIMPDESKKPIAFASCTLTKAECNYSQLGMALQCLKQFMIANDFTCSHATLIHLMAIKTSTVFEHLTEWNPFVK